MSFRKRNKERKRTLVRKHTQNVKRPKTRGRFPSIIQKDRLPEGVEIWTCKEGEHLIDVIPWEAGPDMPLTDNGTVVTAEGDLDYVLRIWVHQNVGAMKQPYVCPYQNFGEPCPICEYLSSRRLPKEEWDAIRPKERTVYLIWSHDTKEDERKGVQIWEVASFFMEQKLDKISKLPKGGGVVDFSDYDNGKSISFEREGKGGGNTVYEGHSFIEREMPIPDKILDQTFAVDQVINMRPSYEEIEKSFRGTLAKIEREENSGNTYDEGGMGDVPDWSGETDDDEETPKRTRKSARRKSKTKDSAERTSKTRTKSSAVRRKRKRTRE